jgi:hypothetical protein
MVVVDVIFLAMCLQNNYNLVHIVRVLAGTKNQNAGRFAWL